MQLFFKIYLFYRSIMNNNVVSIIAIQQSDSIMHIYMLFHILFHYGLSYHRILNITPYAIH